MRSYKQTVHKWAGSCYEGPLADAGCDLGAPERGKLRPYATQRTTAYDWATKNTGGSRFNITVRLYADTEREADDLGAIVLRELTSDTRPEIGDPLYVQRHSFEDFQTTEIPKEGGETHFVARVSLEFYVGVHS